MVTLIRFSVELGGNEGCMQEEDGVEEGVEGWAELGCGRCSQIIIERAPCT